MRNANAINLCVTKPNYSVFIYVCYYIFEASTCK